MIVAGFGSRAGCRLDDLLAALWGALAQSRVAFAEVKAFGAPARKASESGLIALAERLAKPLFALTNEELEAHGSRTLTHSVHALQHYGVPCVAEAAALATMSSLGVQHARLLAPRHAAGGATCALAQSENSV
jgi:cobalamin biosynthesis protein CbiG